jgi:hypothetical protein
MAPALEYVTSCRICGKDVARSVSLDIPIMGQPGQRAEKLLALLVKHLTAAHLPEFQKGMALLQEFQAFCVLNAFAFGDPSIMPRLELTRASVFASVRKNVITDEAIVKLATELSPDVNGNDPKVIEVMKAVRDACCELGPYAPKIPGPARVQLP